jgi:hypothetical protein
MYTFPMSSDFIICRWLESLHYSKCTLPLVYGQEITTRLFNGLIQFVAHPLRFHQRCQSRTNKGPTLRRVVLKRVHSFTHSFQVGGSVESPLHPLHQLVCQTSLYHILHQAVPMYTHGCTVLMGGRSMNRSLDLGMMTNHRLLESTGQSPELSESTEHSSIPVIQIPILHTNREQ